MSEFGMEYKWSLIYQQIWKETCFYHFIFIDWNGAVCLKRLRRKKLCQLTGRSSWESKVGGKLLPFSYDFSIFLKNSSVQRSETIMQTDSRRLRSLIVSPVAVAMKLLAARFSLCQVKTALTALAVFSSCFYPSAEKQPVTWSTFTRSARKIPETISRRCNLKSLWPESIGLRERDSPRDPLIPVHSV